MNSGSTPRLLIVGASTRAAAWSAFRAGYRPVCADQFADRDLQQVAEAIPIRHYPTSLLDDLSEISTDAWMFVGAMENHRRVLGQLQLAGRFGRYCGPSLAAISQLRDPFQLRDRLKPWGCYPQVANTAGEGAHPTQLSVGRWLHKPLASGGGRAISFACRNEPGAERGYWQQYIEGMPCSALYLVTGGRCQVLMLSRQLVGLDGIAAPNPFAYCGSLGPWPMSAAMSGQLANIGAALISGLDYVGLLGADLVWDGERFWVIEVNPRYTASAELWELASGQSAVCGHLAAGGFTERNARISAPPRVRPIGPRLFGKLVLYADRDLNAPDLGRFLATRSVWSAPYLADVPQTGLRIAAGSPVCTVFASSRSETGCFEKLERRAKRVRRWFSSAEISAETLKNS